MTTPITLICAPSNLGLRPLVPGHEPGTWAAPQALLDAGLHVALAPVADVALARPAYDFSPEPGTQFLNGQSIRAFNLKLAEQVAAALVAGTFPLVIGGDCTVLLGCLAAVRQNREAALVHIDGHSDWRHKGNYDFAQNPGAAAGADLALATGRGEALLTQWGQAGPLVREENVIQIGERENRRADYDWADISRSAITQFDIFAVRERGLGAVIAEALDHLDGSLLPFWLHVDLDVLDQAVLPAVDSPGSPGLDAVQLVTLIKALTATGRCLGADITIFDPEGDPTGQYARDIIALLAAGFA